MLGLSGFVGRRSGRWVAILPLWVAFGGVSGCSSLSLSSQRPDPKPVSELVGVHRREAMMHSPEAPTVNNPSPTTRPAEALDVLTKPYRLNPESIIHLVYHMNPLVNASREEMTASQYALDEFEANLSRLEPFVEVNSKASDFPERSDARAVSGEFTGGLEKETFEGAIIRVEGGISGSRVKFGQIGEDEDSVESGRGSVLRARLEVPFVGSRRRQNRVISRAFQESSNRQAKLRYITNYRTYVLNALQYYRSTLLYRNYACAYDDKAAELRRLLQRKTLKPEERSRVESNLNSTESYRDQYQASHRASLARLMSMVGISSNEDIILEEPEYRPSPYLERTAANEGKRQLLLEAYENNPRFRVLSDAIADTELQKRQAIDGEYDITAFVQGTQFPFGAETFDDRVGGWEIGGGVTIRLNDKRVLSATRLKAEAEIRQFQALIEAEKLRIKQQIAIETDTLWSYYRLRDEIVELIQLKAEDYEERKEAFFGVNEQDYLIDDVLYPLGEWTSAKVRLGGNTYYGNDAEDDLKAATGEVYRIVGMQIEDDTPREERAAGPWGLLKP